MFVYINIFFIFLGISAEFGLLKSYRTFITTTKLKAF